VPPVSFDELNTRDLVAAITIVAPSSVARMGQALVQFEFRNSALENDPITVRVPHLVVQLLRPADTTQNLEAPVGVQRGAVCGADVDRVARVPRCPSRPDAADRCRSMSASVRTRSSGLAGSQRVRSVLGDGHERSCRARAPARCG
jgi:hypothetical protein